MEKRRSLIVRVLFHSPVLNFRGVTNSILDFAIYNQTILNNESDIIFNPGFIPPDMGLDVRSNQRVVSHLKSKFNILEYTNEKELNDIASNYDIVYSQNNGLKQSPYITSTKTINHVVFQYYQPHGDRYAYISEWLSNHVSRGKCPFVPLVVDLPEPEDNLRKEIGIPDDYFVIGRHGGFFTFDLQFVFSAIAKIVNQNNNIVFLFANTYPFYEHPRIIYVNPFFGNKAKTSFINACDAMIHGRKLGESFGLSIGEGLFHNKPVLAWEGGYDLNHTEILKGQDLLYTEENIESMILGLGDREKKDYKHIVTPYNAKNTMEKFNQVFLQ